MYTIRFAHQMQMGNTRTCIYSHTHVHEHQRLRIPGWICVHVLMHTYEFAPAHTLTRHAHMPERAHTRPHRYTYAITQPYVPGISTCKLRRTSTHIYTYIHISAYIHTHMYIYSLYLDVDSCVTHDYMWIQVYFELIRSTNMCERAIAFHAIYAKVSQKNSY